MRNIVTEKDRKKDKEGVLLAIQFFQDFLHRFASVLSVEETSSSSQVSIPAKESQRHVLFNFELSANISHQFLLSILRMKIMGLKGQPAASQLQAAAGYFVLVRLADPPPVVEAAVAAAAVVDSAHPLLRLGNLKQPQ